MSQDTKSTDSTQKSSLFSSTPSTTGGLFGSGPGAKPNPPASGSLFGGGTSSNLFNKPASSDPKTDDSKPKSLGLGAAFNPPASSGSGAGSGLFAGAAKPSDDKKPETASTGIKFSGNPTTVGTGSALFGGAAKPVTLGGTTETKTEENKPAAGGIVGNKFSGNPTATGVGFGGIGGKPVVPGGATETKTEEKKPEVPAIGNKFSGNPTTVGTGTALFNPGSGKPVGGATETKTEEKKPGAAFTFTPSASGSSGGGSLFGGGAKPATEEKKPEIKPLSSGGAGGAAPTSTLTGNKISTGPALGGGMGLGGGLTGKPAVPQVGGGVFGGQGKPIGGGTETGEVSVDKVLDKWKGDLSNKAKEFEMLTQNIVEYEKQIMANLEVEQELVKELEKMENEYKAVEFSLEGIMKGQDQLAERVEELESGLSKYQYPNEGQKVNKEKMSREDLIKLAEGMNKEIEGMDSEILKLVEEMSKSAEKKDSGQLTENVMGNYLKTLQFIEAETLKAMTQMNKIENQLANQ